MHLHIQQMQIGDNGTLGILGAEMVAHYESRVHFILQANFGCLIGHRFLEQLECVISSKPTELYADCAVLFSVTVEGGLRNPRAFLKATARKINKLWIEVKAEADYRDCQEWEPWDIADHLKEESDDSYDGFRKVGLFSTDNPQSDQNQIDAEKGPYEPAEED